MDLHWVLPDHTIRETNVPHIHKLIFALEVVNSVCLEGNSYRVVRKELVVEEERCYMAISLAYPPLENV
ncbi:hypothetical protein ACFFNY_19550 [Paenibacillus hodogayensis]|uniref:Uncharacterized protein n=1 Tax=Paenibacillus hodogayensis TaxID=279208 RepID=A0ABV5VZN1_9BACL